MALYRPGEVQRVKNPKSGRKKGTPNKATAEVKTWCQRLIVDPEYRHNLYMRLKQGQAGEMEKLVWYYGIGKPREEQHVTGSLGPLVQVITKGNPIRRMEPTGDLPDDVPVGT